MGDNHYTQTRDAIEDSFRYLIDKVKSSEQHEQSTQKSIILRIEEISKTVDVVFTTMYEQVSRDVRILEKTEPVK